MHTLYRGNFFFLNPHLNLIYYYFHFFFFLYRELALTRIKPVAQDQTAGGGWSWSVKSWLQGSMCFGLLIFFLKHLFMAVLGSSSCVWAFSSQGGFSRCGVQALGVLFSVVEVHRLSYSAAYGIFPDQGLNPCSLHCTTEEALGPFILIDQGKAHTVFWLSEILVRFPIIKWHFLRISRLNFS